MPEIVPVRLTLPSGTWFTLHQRGWQEADDDSLGFLGREAAVYVFRSPGSLSAYVGTSHDHALAASPLWAAVRRRPSRQFEPAVEDCFDLTVTGQRSKDMLAELLVHLGLEPPSADWASEPFAAMLPHRTELVGVPLGRADPRASTGPTLWHWAVSEVEAHLETPSDAEAAAAVLSLLPVEQAAPGVEVLWLGLDGAGAYTLVLRGEDAGWSFLGRPGELIAAESVDDLSRFLVQGGLDEQPWVTLRGRDDVDLEPYEDNVVDLDQLGSLLRPGLGGQQAAALLDAWPLMHELAAWLERADVTEAFQEDQPLGRFFVRDLLDLASGPVPGRWRDHDVDMTAVAESWRHCVSSLASGVRWIG